MYYLLLLVPALLFGEPTAAEKCEQYTTKCDNFLSANTATLSKPYNKVTREYNFYKKIQKLYCDQTSHGYD